MSAVGGGDIPRPTSPHADEILGTLWPLQSESAWHTFASAIKSEATRLFREDDAQQNIFRLVATDQAGAFIDTATRLVRVSTTTLETRYHAYDTASSTAEGVATRIWAIKLRMAESVDAAETAITAAKNELEPQIDAANAALDGVRAGLLAAELASRITAAITQAQTEVTAEAATGAAEIATLNTKLASGNLPDAGGATALNWGSGAGAPAAPAAPLPTDTGGGVRAVDYQRSLNGADRSGAPQAASADNDGRHLPSDSRDARVPEPTARDAAGAATHGDPAAGKSVASSLPPAASTPSTGGGGSSLGSGGSPASVLGSAMRPVSSSASSPASSSGASTSAGSPTGFSGAGASGAQPGSGASAGSGAAASGVSRAVSGAGLGTGIAETSARMGTGAVAAAANAVNSAGNVGAQIAQQSAAASTAAPPATAPPSAGGPLVSAGPAPMAMMSPGAGGGVAGGFPAASSSAATATGPGVPGTTQQGPAATAQLGGPASSGGAGSNATPVMMPVSQVRTVGLDGATGETLIGQAAAAARFIVETVIAQTRHAGYGTSKGFTWAATVISERTGQITAWLATSEGPSYIPQGVRVPDDVRLAVTDPVVGRQLWDAAATAGGADPLDLLARHAQLRDDAAPGLQVLALAASVPMDRVTDWAATVGARPVSIDPRTIDPAPAHRDIGQHRCAAAMPWEWQQANAFSEQQRLQVAARHMLMAASTGHLSDRACERVMDAFERGTPITDSEWADVRQAVALAWVNYEMARSGLSPDAGVDNAAERAFRTARAAEVVWCLRDFRSAEGCADLLYASRLAGAPLNPAAAVA